MIGSRCTTFGRLSRNTRSGVLGSCSGPILWESTGKACGTDTHYIADDRDSFTATVPAVIQQLGYSSANAQLLTIPIYVFAMLMTIIFAFWSDKVQQRSPFIMAGYCIAAFGFIGQLAIPHTRLPGLTYGFLFPVAAGLYCPFVHIVCWTGKFSSATASSHLC
jgi:hypothetical protein